MPGDQPTRVAAVVDPDEEVREAVSLLLRIEFGYTCETAPDFPTLLRTLSAQQMLFVVVRFDRITPFPGAMHVPIVPLDRGPINEQRVISSVRTAVKALRRD